MEATADAQGTTTALPSHRGEDGCFSAPAAGRQPAACDSGSPTQNSPARAQEKGLLSRLKRLTAQAQPHTGKCLPRGGEEGPQRATCTRSPVHTNVLGQTQQVRSHPPLSARMPAFSLSGLQGKQPHYNYKHEKSHTEFQDPRTPKEGRPCLGQAPSLDMGSRQRPPASFPSPTPPHPDPANRPRGTPASGLANVQAVHHPLIFSPKLPGSVHHRAHESETKSPNTRAERAGAQGHGHPRPSSPRAPARCSGFSVGSASFSWLLCHPFCPGGRPSIVDLQSEARRLQRGPAASGSGHQPFLPPPGGC